MAAASLSSRFLELAREAGAVEAQGGQSGTEVESGVLYAQPIRLQVAHGGPPLQLAEYQGVVGLMERRLQTFRPFDHGGDILGVGLQQVPQREVLRVALTPQRDRHIALVLVVGGRYLRPQFLGELAHDGSSREAARVAIDAARSSMSFPNATTRSAPGS